jgi:hypothetical protein
MVRQWRFESRLDHALPGNVSERRSETRGGTNLHFYGLALLER